MRESENFPVVGPHGQSPWHPLRRPSTRFAARDDRNHMMRFKIQQGVEKP